ncbi:TonB-linked outer membrane protein, SusC/RagA family [Pedobacter sp. ok626]|uniref:TonB-dependent receptor n=1 Tax=Pedobacter sp. ok626 TaxID=1761882 RepID=UPI00088AAEC5|nr:TonB-dependent receptor [Pedobacter sp. ok626]SDL42051.1 TonB-linked outer membrane protein, SusC/RagA family [Pedobacter sp. ok626]
MNFNLKVSIDLRYIMRITLSHLILFFVFTGVTYASPSKAQGLLNTTISMNVGDISLREALTAIEKTAKTKFVYSNTLINANQRVSVNANGERLSTILTKLLTGNGITFELFNEQIVLGKAKAFPPGLTNAQTIIADVVITGKVTDEKGQALPGVSVKISGTTIGTTTNSTGSFTLSVPEDKANGKLQFIYIGFESQEVAIASKTNFAIKLLEEKKTLSEIVVIGYGTQSKSKSIGAISKITAESIEERPITRVEQALQGQMAGVTVRSTSGSPGSDITVNVRGAASITGSTTPLYIVDGVPLDNLSGINPSDIASIDVLKDAASAAIYGARGSNGVVMVTTKKGKSGKPVFNIAAYTAVATAEKKVDVMSPDEWITFSKKYLDRLWVNATNQSGSVSQADRIAYAQSLAPPNTVYQTRDQLLAIRTAYGIYDPYWGTSAIEPIDWQDELLRSAPVNDLQLGVSGATDDINYSISGGAYNQKGIIVGSGYNRYSLRANVEAKLSDRVKLGLSLAPSIGTITGANVDGKDNAVSRALSFPGWVPAGSGKMAGSDPYKFYDGWGPGADNVSPYVQAVYNERTNSDFRMNTALNTTVKIIDGLNANGLLGWNYRNNSQRTYSPTWIQGTWNKVAPGALSTSRKTGLFYNSLLYQGTLNYNKELGKHSIDGLLGVSQETYKEESSDQGYTGFPNDKTYVFDLKRGTTINQNTISAASNALISYFGRVQYSYDNRYLFSASLRRDGSSKFGPNNRWGTFPALSAGWVISAEDFAKSFEWLSTAKVRASWGQTGNDRIGSSNFLSNMGALNYPLGETNQTVNNGFVVGNIANSNLRWEKTDSYNIGLDLAFIQNRVALSVDAYFKKTSDLLLQAPVSLTTGFSSMLDNIGNVDNKGVDIQVNTINFVAPIKWSTSFNVSINRNKITELTNSNADIKLGLNNTIIQRVGSPVNSYYLLDAQGVLRESDFTQDANGKYTIPKLPILTGQKPGDTKYRDANGDGKIDANDYIVAGNYQPKFEFGITNSVSYKNWDLSVLLQGRVGGDLLSIGSRGWNRATGDTRYNYMESWLTKAYWSEAEPGDGKVSAFYSIGSEYDTNWMYSASYLRIKNVTLGYNVPVLKKVFSSIRLYTSCDNVFMWDSYYPGYSPEGATQDNASSDWGSYPLARTISFGLSAKF